MIITHNRNIIIGDIKPIIKNGIWFPLSVENGYVEEDGLTFSLPVEEGFYHKRRKTLSFRVEI